MAATLNILKRAQSAAVHCRTCPSAGRIGNASVDCDGSLVAFVNGKCKRGLWDHSGKVEFVPEFFELCKERLAEEWGEEWQAKILAAVIRETEKKYILPISLYEEALKNRK